MSGLVQAVGRILPRGYADAFGQLGLFVCALLAYETVRGLVEGRASVAFANARAIVDIQKATGTYFEPALQAAVIDHRWIIELANLVYMNSHFVVTTTFLVWLYLRRNEHFGFVRNMFLIAMALAAVCYAVVPTAPPRLLPEEGFVDTINAYSAVNHDSALVAMFVNPYAAVPSMHMCFALLVALPAMALVRNPVVRAGWMLYPLLVLFVIIVTANHFWLDAAAGAAVAGASAVAALRLARLRPHGWAFPARATT